MEQVFRVGSSKRKCIRCGGDRKVKSYRSFEYSQYHSDFMLNLRNLGSSRWMKTKHTCIHFSVVVDQSSYLTVLKRDFKNYGQKILTRSTHDWLTAALMRFSPNRFFSVFSPEYCSSAWLNNASLPHRMPHCTVIICFWCTRHCTQHCLATNLVVELKKHPLSL
jgi:hypothetical protein